MNYISRHMGLWTADTPGPDSDAILAVIGHLL